MDQNRRIAAANVYSTNTINRRIASTTLCHSCGSVIQDIIPPPPTTTATTGANGAQERRTEEPIPERYTFVAIYISGIEGVYLTFCHKCNENFEAINGARQNIEAIVDESGDHERLLACLECIPLNYSIGDGPENCAPYVVNIRYTEPQF